MPDESFRLLVALVAELTRGASGWLKMFMERGKYQPYARLRKSVEGSLLERNARNFIENNGSKGYRILTHPDFVTYERGNLLKHTNTEVRGLARGKTKKED